ncbi:protein FAM219A isoform X1 [Cynoglossus semilaevis]|uniref:Family with sequence similarity 219 member Aa n=1 Tax=Cynoglossus semilaevis TaxID=244447 RepID=A0A3P8V182_CYNSE|nr:protein FAM219A isoform X1 [Cynoglossus semilaevis]
MMEEIDRFQVPPVNGETQPLDPAASSTSEPNPDNKGETVALNYKPSPLQVQIEKQRDLARKGSVKNGTVGSPVNQQPKKNARTRLVVPNKGYSSLDQSPDEKPLVALDTDSDDDFDMSRYSSSGYSSAEVRCLRDQVSMHMLYCSCTHSITARPPTPLFTPGTCAATVETLFTGHSTHSTVFCKPVSFLIPTGFMSLSLMVMLWFHRLIAEDLFVPFVVFLSM